jgi:hypothetical protein
MEANIDSMIETLQAEIATIAAMNAVYCNALEALNQIKIKGSNGNGKHTPKGITLIQPSPLTATLTTSNAAALKTKTRVWTDAQRAKARAAAKARWAGIKAGSPASPAIAKKTVKKKSSWTPEQRAAQSERMVLEHKRRKAAQAKAAKKAA